MDGISLFTSSDFKRHLELDARVPADANIDKIAAELAEGNWTESDEFTDCYNEEIDSIIDEYIEETWPEMV